MRNTNWENTYICQLDTYLCSYVGGSLQTREAIPVFL